MSTATTAVVIENDEYDILDREAAERRKLMAIRIVSIVLLLAIWEIFGRRVNPLFMSYPSKIIAAAFWLAGTGELWTALFESLRTLVLGFAGAAVVGVIAGLFIGRYREVDAAVDWLVNALYATPLIALIPLVILWFGLGFTAKFFIVFLLAVFPVLINTATGVRNVSGSLVDVGVAFVANERQIFTKIILPGSLPYIMTGLRLGVGRAIIAMVTAEFFTAISGLGGIIVKYGNSFRTDVMLVPVIVLMIMGVTLTSGLSRVEALLAPWKVQARE
jgi:ABC-type nitrate/sulfonate/bicarbonate transport system permease component